MIRLDARFPRHAALWERVRGTPTPGELAHDGHHLGRVYGWAVRLAPEAGADPDLSGAAALVHDLVPIPKDDPARAEAGALSARAAGPLLTESGYADHEVVEICDAVATSSWSRGLMPNGPLGAVLQDADRLDALGAVGIARTFATAQVMSRPAAPGRFYDPSDPLGATGRPLDDRLNAVDHFRRKLLTLAATMHTPTANAEAARRHGTLVTFLDALSREANV